MRVLAADIGGTNSRFALYDTGEPACDGVPGPRERLCATYLPTAASAAFPDLLRRAAAAEPELFTPARGAPPALLVLAVAGPVWDGRSCVLPNIPWAVDLDAPALRAPDMPPLPPVLLINDFVAQAYACLRPAVLDPLAVLDGAPVPAMPVAVLGAGTGLGKCLLLSPPDADAPPLALPSEGGHALFPFVDEREMAFAAFIRAHTGQQVTGDLVVSGPGLRLLHAFHTGQWVEPADAAARLTVAGDGEGADRVLPWFARFYGRACRDYVLETLALGGLFITGGVAAAAPELVTHPAFAEAFRHSDAHADLLRRVPVRLVRNTDAGLLGAALYGVLNGVPGNSRASGGQAGKEAHASRAD